MIQNTGHCRSQTTAAAENGGVVTVVHSFAVMLVVSFIPFLANADGGVVRLQERQGPFTITIFTPTVIPGGLPTDITVMVQRRDSCEVVMDADVELEIAPVGTSVNVDDLICGPGKGVRADMSGRATAFVATHAQAANKVLYGSSVVFPGTGNWQLGATIRHGSQAAKASCIMAVSTSPSRLAAVWPCIALPPLAIALFSCNQWLRNRQRGNLSNEFGKLMHL